MQKLQTARTELAKSEIITNALENLALRSSELPAEVLHIFQ